MKKLLPLAVVLLLAVLPVLASDARFKGTGKADPIRVTDARLIASSDAGQSAITFDIAWDWSWRAAWEEPAARTGDQAPLKLESWDAAWVFAKIKMPGKDVWQHATLSTDASRHTVPAGVSLELGLSDPSEDGATSGTRGIGAFIFRSTPGQGPNVWKGITLTCADVPANAEVRVFALPMVYVPSGAFWAGDGSTTTNRIKGQFSAGTSTKPFRITGEQALALGGEAESNLGNRNAAGMSNRRAAEDFNVRFTERLGSRFPKGYAAFYCMRTELTQQHYVDFLNTLTYKQQAARMADKPSSPAKKIGPSSGKLSEADRRVVIVTSGIADSTSKTIIDRGTFTASGDVPITGQPAVYMTPTPDLPCNNILFSDGAAYMAWAGLRPMTELEFEKACRGPLLPVPDEYAWGTADIAGMDGKGAYTIKNAGMPDETVVWEGEGGPDATRGNAPFDLTNKKLNQCPIRTGCFATPDSDRARAGASYWGILDLTGNVIEGVVGIGSPGARTFAGNHGEGGDALWTIPFGMRGGGIPGSGHQGNWDGREGFRVSNRFTANVGACEGEKQRFYVHGFRGVRTSRAQIEKALP